MLHLPKGSFELLLTEKKMNWKRSVDLLQNDFKAWNTWKRSGAEHLISCCSSPGFHYNAYICILHGINLFILLEGHSSYGTLVLGGGIFLWLHIYSKIKPTVRRKILLNNVTLPEECKASGPVHFLNLCHAPQMTARIQRSTCFQMQQK